MKKHDIYDGTEFSTEGVKYWHENAKTCCNYVNDCGMFSRNCGTCMYHVNLSAEGCEDAGISPDHRMYCMASVEN